MLLILLVIFLLLYAVLIFFYWKEWSSAKQFSPAPLRVYKFISVIVAARNEEEHILPLLQALKEQSYPTEYFEIIIVDDFSTDATATRVKNFSAANLLLMQPDTNPDQSSKKKAIAAGINRARGELIVITDADCLPSRNWLEMMAGFYVQNDAAFIAAPVKYSGNNSLLQIFQSIDFMTLQGITAASVSAHFHTMCNGANLAYQKQAFLEVNGFEGIDTVATGDDLLLMYKIWKKHPRRTFYLKNKDAIVTTRPMASWKAFLMQRKRWASKTLVYDDRRILAVLVFVYLFNLLFPVLIVASFFNALYWWYVAGFLVIKTVIEFPFVHSLSKFYEEQRLMKYFFFLQPLHIFYTVFVGWLSQSGKYEWKGRRTK
jgi:cellulose synthase/poly-beta-1,6-N-acetylglucosamine synthase-like glycosyltransferase